MGIWKMSTRVQPFSARAMTLCEDMAWPFASSRFYISQTSYTRDLLQKIRYLRLEVYLCYNYSTTFTNSALGLQCYWVTAIHITCHICVTISSCIPARNAFLARRARLTVHL